MLNTDMVNVRGRFAFRAHFRESFLDSGRFLLFKSPVKYTRIFDINQSARDAAATSGTSGNTYVIYINDIRV